MQLLKPPWVNHDGDKAIFSVDIHPDGTRFATGGQGQDSSGRVVIWNLKPVVSDKAEKDEKIPKLLCQLDQHLGCVNCVRWSNSGRFLASAGDDKAIIIWQQSCYGGGSVFGSNVVNVESWRIVSTLRGHNGDILDIAWSPGDVWLASASIDNNVIIWNAKKWPEQIAVLRGHTGLVKGVAWDPVGRYVASQADDKSMRIWKTSTWAMEQKVVEPFTECGGTTSLLRPSWSPDGQYLVSAHAMNNGGPTAQIIERDGWNTDKDFVGHRKAVTCVRFNPNILKKQESHLSKSVQYCCVAIGARDRALSIWFTSLKRPLIVIHDIFEDTVLDLSWSKCGNYLMAVSKDGTLAFVNFSEKEIGKALSPDETNSLHIKLYGNSAVTSAAAATTIIENPEILKIQNEGRESEAFNTNKSNSEHPTNKANNIPNGPTNKQIEIRTADGRRRITPMFIPPADGDSHSQSEMSFSSSRQEKSKIIVEKLDGVVQPNVSSPTKSPMKAMQDMQDQNSNVVHVQSAAQPDLESVPAGLSARIEGAQSTLLSPCSEKEKVLQSVAIKRKREVVEEVDVPIKKKRGRGRPPLYDRCDSAQLITSRPLSPTLVHQKVAPTMLTKQVTQIVQTRHILASAAMPRTSKLLIPGAPILDDGTSATLLIENEWRSTDPICSGAAGSTPGAPLPALHKVSRCEAGSDIWFVYLPTNVKAAVTTKEISALACKDSLMHLLDNKTGSYILPPIQLSGSPSLLKAQGNYVTIITTDAFMMIWDFEARRRVLKESIRHLVEGRSSVSAILILGEISPVPVVVLHTGEAYNWNENMQAWMQVGEGSAIRRFVSPEFSVIPMDHSVQKFSPLTSILRHSSTYSGSSRFTNSAVSDDVKQGLTEGFIKRMMSSAQLLNAKLDFKFWLKKLVKFFISEGFENSLRKIFDSFLGPQHSGSSEPSSSKWCPHLLGMSKHELLEEFLRELLLAENSIKFQRMHTEYAEQLKGMDVDDDAI